MGSLIPHHGDPRIAVEIVFVILPAVIDQKILFLINQPENVTPACLKIGSQLNGQSRTRLLTESSVNTTGEIDPEPSSIPAPVCSFGRLHGDTTRGTDGRAKVAGHTALITIRVTSQYNDSSSPGRKGSLVFRVLLGHRFSEKDLKSRHQSFCQTFYSRCESSDSFHDAPSLKPS
jgi:hypothetical protein